MANGFNKQETVAFEDICEGFEDALVLSKNVNVYQPDAVLMERSGDTIWRPQPYIAQSADYTPGSNITIPDTTQLSVPTSIGFAKHSSWKLTSSQLIDALREGSLGKAARQKLASDVNKALMDVASLQGSLVVKSTTAAASATFADIAECDALMNEQGVPMGDRFLALGSRANNGLANDLSKASRSMDAARSLTAYDKAYIGPVAGFETFKLDYAVRKAAAAGGASITIATTSTTNNHVPKATSTSVGGQVNVDNRFQSVVVSSTTSVAVGDCFTIAGVNAVHHITKEDTGSLKTFRVVEIVDSTHMKITPPIISASSSPTDAEKQYQNCKFVTTSGTAAIVWLNTAAAPINPFWHRDSLEIIPGRSGLQDGNGVSVLRYTTPQGLELSFEKAGDILADAMTYRMNIRFGVVNKNPEMNGIILFGQS